MKVVISGNKPVKCGDKIVVIATPPVKEKKKK